MRKTWKRNLGDCQRVKINLHGVNRLFLFHSKLLVYSIAPNILRLRRDFPTPAMNALRTTVAIALLAFAACSEKSPKGPSKEDIAALNKLRQDFIASEDNPAEQIRYIDPVSVDKYMEAQRSLIEHWDFYGPEGMLEKCFTFKPDARTAIKQKDSDKYFAIVAEKPPFFAKWKFKKAKLAAISVEKNSAYFVFEQPPDEDTGYSRPEFIVQPAVRTEKGWRMDVSSTYVRAYQNLLKLFQ